VHLERPLNILQLSQHLLEVLVGRHRTEIGLWKAIRNNFIFLDHPKLLLLLIYFIIIYPSL